MLVSLKLKKTKFELRITLKQSIYTVEPRYNEPLYNEVFGITKNFVYPSNSKIYGKNFDIMEPRYREQI